MPVIGLVGLVVLIDLKSSKFWSDVFSACFSKNGKHKPYMHIIYTHNADLAKKPLKRACLFRVFGGMF